MWKIVLGTLTLVAPWLLLIYQLVIVWETNVQYAHGYLVPFLCLLLILRSYPQENDTEDSNSPSPFQGKIAYFVCIPVLILFLSVWLVRGANSDWRLINLALFSLTLLYTFALLYDDGGWIRIKYLIFPFLFFLVAIPWPLKTDLELTLWLQTKVSSIIVDILLLTEHEAYLKGTVIDVGTFGTIGVDQACSGINGLQASLVVTLFIGAYHRFGLLNRIVLVFAGIIIAIVFNLGRAFALSYIKVKGKGHYLDEPLFSMVGWSAPSVHDLAGWIETGLIFAAILILARMATGGLFLTAIPNESNRWINLRCSPNTIFGIACLIILSGGAIWTEAHYRGTEEGMAYLPILKLNLDDPNILTSKQDISRQVASQLHYQEATSTQWQDRFRNIFNNFGQLVINANAEYWQAFEARWDSGGACTAVLSTHSPESCLPLTGLTQINPAPGQEPMLVPIKIAEREVLFEAYEFSRNYRKLFVFRCFWPHKLALGQPNFFPRGGYNFSGRIDSALEGRRNVGGTMLALALANVDSSQTAIAKLQTLANHRLSFSAAENQ